MKTLEKIASMNANNIEKKQMEELFGGLQVGGVGVAYTLDTITCTPNGNKNDPNDDPNVPEVSGVSIGVQGNAYN